MSLGNYTNRISPSFLQSVTPHGASIIASVRLLIYDFDTGQSALLPRHIEGLDRFVVPLLGPESVPASVWIGGLASRRGDTSINIPLARARATMVERFLFARSIAMGFRHGVTTTSFGEQYSAYHTENSEYYRSVLVLVNHRRRVPEAPRVADLASILATNFRIRLVEGGDAGEVIAMGRYDFIIDYDISHESSPPSAPVRYKLEGGGVGVGAPAGGGRADPTNPVWNPFHTEFATTTSGFHGQARLSGIGASAGPLSVGYTTLRLFPDASPSAIVFEPFQTGTSGIQLGASIIHGPFRIDPDFHR